MCARAKTGYFVCQRMSDSVCVSESVSSAQVSGAGAALQKPRVSLQGGPDVIIYLYLISTVQFTQSHRVHMLHSDSYAELTDHPEMLSGEPERIGISLLLRACIHARLRWD